MNLEQARFNMIQQQIRPWDVLNGELLELLTLVRREEFVPASHKALAFADIEIPLRNPTDAALRLGQCMLAPKVEARLVQDAAVQKHEKVLEIGTGSGYLAALLAHLSQRVITLEIEPELVALARSNLQKAGILNAEVRLADGSKGVPLEAPFDVILLSGSVAEIPDKLLESLKPGGRLVAIVGEEPIMRATTATRTAGHGYSSNQGWDTVAPRLQNFPEHSRFNF